MIRAHLLEPTKPLAARTLVNAVKAGETIVIFPEGRITVTGSLMKVYDGAAMIADRADAWMVPVRIDGRGALAARLPAGLADQEGAVSQDHASPSCRRAS